MLMKINWKKSPSVFREGKFFYHAKFGLTTISCRQNWVTGLWEIKDNYRRSVFAVEKTSKAAMKAFEKIAPKFADKI